MKDQYLLDAFIIVLAVLFFIRNGQYLNTKHELHLAQIEAKLVTDAFNSCNISTYE